MNTEPDRSTAPVECCGVTAAAGGPWYIRVPADRVPAAQRLTPECPACGEPVAWNEESGTWRSLKWADNADVRVCLLEIIAAETAGDTVLAEQLRTSMCTRANEHHPKGTI